MGLNERRKIKELQETTFPAREKEIEEICGKAVTGKRTQIVLATKATMPVGSGPNDRGASRKHLRESKARHVLVGAANDPSALGAARAIQAAGREKSYLIGGQNAVNFAYILYLRGRAEGMPAADLERLVRRWYVMSQLTGRYAGSPETTFDQDIRQIEAQGLASYTTAVINAALPESFWSTLLPQEMDTSASSSPYFLVYKAAQVKLGDKGFLSRDITIRDLLLNRSDAHHVYPRNHLKKQGLSRGRYNQIANFVLAQSEINIAVGDRAPEVYFEDLAHQCNGGTKKYGGITDLEEMRANLRMNCLPDSLLDGVVPSYDEFLDQRRKLMAQKIKTYFESL